MALKRLPFHILMFVFFCLFVSACQTEKKELVVQEPVGIPTARQPIIATFAEENVGTPISEKQEGVATPTQIPAPFPEHTSETIDKSVSICVWQKVQNLYFHSRGDSQTEALIVNLVYGQDIHLGSFVTTPNLVAGYSPVKLDEVEVKEGEYYFGSGLSPHFGDPITLPQARRTIHFNANILWSDGTPVTAYDSALAYDFWMRGDYPLSVDFPFKTIKYEAIDDQTIEWIGAPGYVPPEDWHEVWVPLLPTYIMQENHSRMYEKAGTVSFGPYFVAEFQQFHYIKLQKNPYYIDELFFERLQNVTKFIFVLLSDKQEAMEAYRAQQCDLLGIEDISLEWLKSTLEQTNQ